MRTTKSDRRWRWVLAACAGVSASAGCESDAQTGALLGAGIGALAGQAIGGDTGGTLIGAGVGGGLGYIIGNESDKKKARTAEAAPPPPPPPSRDPPPAAYPAGGSLTDTRWQVIEMESPNAPPFFSKVMEFRSGGRVITTTTDDDGTVHVSDDKFQVEGNRIMVFNADNPINAHFSIDGDEMIMLADGFRLVLRRIG